MGKYSLEKKKEFVLTEEDATKQFMLFVEFYDIDIDEIAKAVSEQQDKKITADEIGDEYVKEIRLGKYMIFENDEGVVNIKQYFVKPLGKNDDFTDITYGVLRGKNRKDMGGCNSDDKEVRSIALLNSLSHTAGNMVEKLIGGDYATALGIAGLYFLTVG